MLNFFSKKTKKKTDQSQNRQQEKLKPFTQGLVNIQDIIAPEALEVDFSFLKIGKHYFRTLFVAGYPRFVNANWLSPIINFDHSLDISMFIYPIEGKGVMEDLKRKIAEMEAEIQADVQRGRIVNIETQVKLDHWCRIQLFLGQQG